MACILLIEDDAVVREIIRRMLEEAGHTVVEAAEGREGLRVYDTHRVPLVILDIFMPEQEGFETMRLLQARAPDVKILVISGGGAIGALGSMDVLATAALLGADRVLRKPVPREALLAAVQSLLAAG